MTERQRAEISKRAHVMSAVKSRSSVVTPEIRAAYEAKWDRVGKIAELMDDGISYEEAVKTVDRN